MATTVIVGIDTGGTFTDLVAIAGSRLLVHKVLSTPDDPARAVIAGLKAMLESTRGGTRGGLLPDLVTYSSTVATNALLERKGARVVLLTNAGFEDLVEIGRQNRSDLYSLAPERPEPLVARAMRLGVAERTYFDGKVALPLSAAELKRVRRAAASRRADSIAICLLHSYANPASEQRLARALVPMGLPLSVSHRILAEYREFERLSTTVVNAYVAPRMSSHLGRLERDLRAARLRVMQSNGSAIGARLARDEPVRTILSGPAAGVIGAAALVARNRRRSLHHFRHGRDFDRRVAVRRPCCYPHAQLSRRLRRPHSRDRHPHRGRGRRLDRCGRRRRLAQGRSRKRRRRSGASLLWTRRRRPPLPTRTWSPGV